MSDNNDTKISDELLKLKQVKKRTDPNDKINKRLFNMNDDQHNADKLFICEKIFKNKSHENTVSQEILTPISLDYSKYMEKIMAEKPRFDAFDREVCFACISEQTAGNKFTTVNALYRNMTGDDKMRRPTEQMIQRIKTSLSKLTFSEVTIDLSEVCVKYGFRKPGSKVILHSAIVPGKYTEDRVNGQTSILVEFYEPSPLFAAAEIKNYQILTYDKKLLNVPIRNTPDIITIKAYILRRVLEIIAHNMIPTITFDDVFEKNNLLLVEPKQKMRLRNNICKMFDFWKKLHLISEYKVNKDSHIPVSISFSYSVSKNTKIQNISNR